MCEKAAVKANYIYLPSPLWMFSLQSGTSTVQPKILMGKILMNLTNFDNSSKFSLSIFLKNGTFKVLIRILLERGISSMFSSSLFQREVICQNFPVRILRCTISSWCINWSGSRVCVSVELVYNLRSL